MGNPIHSGDSSRLRCKYHSDVILPRGAAFGFELSGKFQLLTNASSCMYGNKEEYNDILSSSGSPSEVNDQSPKVSN